MSFFVALAADTVSGIGKKIVPAARQVLEALNLDMQFVELPAGMTAISTVY